MAQGIDPVELTIGQTRTAVATMHSQRPEAAPGQPAKVGRVPGEGEIGQQVVIQQQPVHPAAAAPQELPAAGEQSIRRQQPGNPQLEPAGPRAADAPERQDLRRFHQGKGTIALQQAQAQSFAWLETPGCCDFARIFES